MFVDVHQFYEKKRAILPLDCALNMVNWHPVSLMERKQVIFEKALFYFTLILCAVDYLNHADAIKLNDEERRMPTSFDLMELKNRDKLISSRYDILVNEFPFQLGIQIRYLKSLEEKMFSFSYCCRKLYNQMQVE